MAWEEYERDGVKGLTGDDPMDEIALSLQRIAEAYEEQFDRKPLMDELLYAFEIVIGATPESYVSDPDGLKSFKIMLRKS